MIRFENSNYLLYKIFSFYFLAGFNFFLTGFRKVIILYFEKYNFFNYLFCLNYIFGYGFFAFLFCHFVFLRKDNFSYTILLFLNSIVFEFWLSYFGFLSGFSVFLISYFNSYFFLISIFLTLFVLFFSLYIFYSNYTEKKNENFCELNLKKSIKKDIEIKQEEFNDKKISILPSIDLLSIGKKIELFIDCDKQKSLLIEVLGDFHISVEVKSVFVGPVVTLYSIELAAGIKASRVISLSDDVARLMYAYSVRISTVPGQNLLGIEVANPKRQMVYFKEGMMSNVYNNFIGNLPLYLGCNIYGEHEVFDLATMPHLLVAGTTGSGKSVAIHTMLLSLFYKKSFEDVKLILIDPKKLEMTPYEDIPHLLLPIVTEAKTAIQAVKWAVEEMERRYYAMSQIGVRNIGSYNQKIKSFKNSKCNGQEYKKLSYIVVVVDEMADLMLVVGKEFEVYIQRLAQMGRAAGIHMIIATQRPSVDVITGTIKANFPTRISFKLSSKIDSRTILGDMSGAEQLLGAGDMLYLGNSGKISRIHGSFVSEEDVFNVVEFLKRQGEPQYIDLSFDSIEKEMEGDLFVDVTNDPYYDEVVKLIKSEKKVSTSFLQRCFPIGYNRAAKLIERMEKEGVISKGDKFGRNREILV